VPATHSPYPAAVKVQTSGLCPALITADAAIMGA
jgi:hypothetical protein